MKLVKTALCAALFFTFSFSYAQVTIRTSEIGITKIEEFSEWKKEEFKFEDGTSATIEYRFALATRKGIACHYDLEVKNASEMKVNVRLKSNYYDKFVKSYFGEEIKESLKPGKSIVGRLIAQGCKKDKGSDLDDFAACMACDFTATISVTK